MAWIQTLMPLPAPETSNVATSQPVSSRHCAPQAVSLCINQSYLRFIDSEEKKFWCKIADDRARCYTDALLHLVSAVLALATIPRLIRAGIMNLVPIALAVSLSNTAAAAFNHPAVLSTNYGLSVQVKKHRALIHIITNSITQIYLFCVLFTGSGVAVVGSSGDRPALGLFVVWLLWQALYPCFAMLSLASSCPMQIVVTVSMLCQVPALSSAAVFHCGHHLYSSLAWLLSYLSSAMILYPSMGSNDDDAQVAALQACKAVLSFFIVATQLPLFYAASFQAERAARQQYSVRKGYLLTSMELKSRKRPLIDAISYMALKLIITWAVVELVYF